jgi:putative toxin-antitoxin system antitoxin component (TIGR02293 family)
VAARPKRDFDQAFVLGLFEGRDWNVMYKIIHEGIERAAFGAPTVNLFLSLAVSSDAIRLDLRNAIVSDRSWKRRVADKSPLAPAEVERMTDVAEVVRETRRLYGGNGDAADKFLTSPHRRFGGRAPILVAATEGGAQAVRELLARMEEGAPA